MINLNTLPHLQILKIVNLAIHLTATWYVTRQLWKGQITAWIWREAWLCILVAMLLMIPFRIADFYESPTYWRLILATPMTALLFLGFYRLARLLRRSSIVNIPQRVKKDNTTYG